MDGDLLHQNFDWKLLAYLIRSSLPVSLWTHREIARQRLQSISIFNRYFGVYDHYRLVRNCYLIRWIDCIQSHVELLLSFVSSPDLRCFDITRSHSSQCHSSSTWWSRRLHRCPHPHQKQVPCLYVSYGTPYISWKEGNRTRFQPVQLQTTDY